MELHNKIRSRGKGEEFSSPFAFPLIAPLRALLISDKSRDGGRPTYYIRKEMMIWQRKKSVFRSTELLYGEGFNITGHESQMPMGKEWTYMLKPVRSYTKRNRKRVGKWKKPYSAKNTLRLRNTAKSGC